MLKRNIIVLVALVATEVCGKAQTVSGNAMEFLDVAQVTRMVGVGGMHVAPGVSSSAMTFQNPGAVADSVSGNLDLNISPITEGMMYASVAYTQKVEGVGCFSLGVLYAGYGDFVRTDEEGNELGDFSANEGAFYLTYSRNLGPIVRMGATVKPVISHLDDETAVALAMDMGAVASFKEGRLQAALVVRNAGGLIKKYSSDSRQDKLPVDVKVGVSYKPAHAPFRFLLTIKDLTHWDLSPTKANKISAGDNILRHTLWGLEFVPVKAFYVGVGYNQRQRKETTASEAGGMAGITWGAGLEIAKIRVQYAHSRYHIAGSMNSITLSTNMTRFFK